MSTARAAQRPVIVEHDPGSLRIDHVAFVHRSAGERTQHASRDLLADQIRSLGGDTSRIHDVAERPFSKAVRRTLELGIEEHTRRRRAWIIAMDADVLLAPGALKTLLRCCAHASPDTFSIVALMLDKLTASFAFRGIHCYRADLLPGALGLADLAKDEQRPESGIVTRMRDLGSPFESIPEVVAVHDFEQSLAHVYVKMLLRTRKEPHPERLLDLATKRAQSDTDFLVARWAIEDALADERAGRDHAYDWFTPHPRFVQRLADHNIEEKPPLERAGPSFVQDMIRAHDFAGDRQTSRWIRSQLRFDLPRAGILRRLGVPGTPDHQRDRA